LLWRIGWLLNSLNYLIHKNLRESIFQNDAYKENRWSLIEQQILPWSERYIRYTFLLAAAWLLNTVAVIIWLSEIKGALPTWLQTWHHIIEWQNNILGSQLTIIGLIFPLVIGFVGMFLKDRSANRSLWKIFSRYSGFEPVSASDSGNKLC